MSALHFNTNSRYCAQLIRSNSYTMSEATVSLRVATGAAEMFCDETERATPLIRWTGHVPMVALFAKVPP